MRIASVGTAYPPHRYPQAVITEALKERMQDKLAMPEIMDRLHRNCGVDYRHIMYPLESLGTMSGFGPMNDLWIKGAVELGQQAVQKALDQAGLEPADISAIFFTSVTGLACPSIDARLVNLMNFPKNIKRTPIFGLGCVAGAAGISRTVDYVRAYPKQYAILLSVELCSLTWQEGDASMAAIVASGLFGDGAAAVIVAGEETPHGIKPTSVQEPCPRVVATKSTFYPNTEHLMGWNINHTGFNIVLSAEVPDLVNAELKNTVEDFLAENNMNMHQICSFIMHSGGPKVLQAMESSLSLPPGALAASWNSLRQRGNLSSASVLTVMQDYLYNRPGSPGCYSMMGAMGPAFCSELLLLQW
ncbi:type III polyketide synthase [Edaphobacter sp. 12200R-103]|jgi:alkylresorcinol/alkylpyrone synthase|uniref:type III polyketide synthase n=1 Tax=Edaphobacter sp. 12200R-103 TaxID=2703788 RepID=UPI00138CFB5E|nr:type III polyketide synthase [Edaphobacter sp. 12200R-103]QHS51539.1 type III polyketide synthase [Edaphobacter sp. 12200R-103]